MQVMSDIDFHGFLAEKIRKGHKTYVTKSNTESIQVGTEVLTLNGLPLCYLKPNEVTGLFEGRLTRLIPNCTVTDCEFHGFVAKKIRRDRPTIVTESNVVSIAIGSVLKTINGTLTDTLTPARLFTFFSNRQNKVLPTFAVENSKTSRDAKNYAKKLDELTMFSNCALCGEEGPPANSVNVSQCHDLLRQTNITDEYNDITECLRVPSAGNKYDIAYAKEIQFYLPNGLLRGETTICDSCHRSLRKKIPLNNATILTGSGLHINDLSHTQNVRQLPSDALIYGLFPGHVPLELSILNSIEQSMISQYSSITKVSLHGGKNYAINGALSYTIVNDITSIALKLPRMPTLDGIAILRHSTGSRTKDYTYRPYHVKRALLWLQENNHLYKNVTLQWPSEHDWDEPNAIGEIPFLSLSENDINAIDENDADQTTNSSTTIITSGTREITFMLYLHC
jgi:hypothetical protein